MHRVDVLVVGAGPAGSCAARAAASGADVSAGPGGIRVLLIEARPIVGLPVQCAEYAPAQIIDWVTFPNRCIAQRTRSLRTHLPDGDVVDTRAAGYVLDRSLFDRALAVQARQAGVEIWTGARAVARTENGVIVRRTIPGSRGVRLVEVACRVLIGADGPRSTIGRWIGQENASFIDARQVEVVLPAPQAFTEVFFDPSYVGGYGWRFPKGDTANVGVGVNRSMGGDPQRALAHLLARLGIGSGDIVGRTGGLVPSGGAVAHIRVGNCALVGDAAGHTHPITGAGLFAAVVSGTFAGRASAAAVRNGELRMLDGYVREWSPFMGGPLRHALEKRRALDLQWTANSTALAALIRESWIAFRAYSQRMPRARG